MDVSVLSEFAEGLGAASASGDDESNLLSLKPVAATVLKNLKARVGALDEKGKDDLLASLLLLVVAESQSGDLKEVLEVLGHLEIKRIVSGVKVDGESESGGSTGRASRSKSTVVIT